ncbi:hypothetical protein MXAN_0591 [Myxococcus xanthus DK 1622]|uniref:Uncharacterized protein n=1 Tax=Myxococcus xanthus (strain DK1622) TaxID=246197 RepID=Q1DER3_MYXXD|nr:hypothetical protein MXAN_0591 [Myxococcus xanthus DK 1622]
MSWMPTVYTVPFGSQVCAATDWQLPLTHTAFARQNWLFPDETQHASPTSPQLRQRSPADSMTHVNVPLQDVVPALTQQAPPSLPHGSHVPLRQTSPALQLAESVLQAQPLVPYWLGEHDDELLWQPPQPARRAMNTIISPRRRGRFDFTRKVLV